MIQYCKVTTSYSRMCHIEMFYRKSIGYLHKDDRGPSLLEDILQSGKRDLYKQDLAMTRNIRVSLKDLRY